VPFIAKVVDFSLNYCILKENTKNTEEIVLQKFCIQDGYICSLRSPPFNLYPLGILLSLRINPVFWAINAN
jgi:hypothetical protein